MSEVQSKTSHDSSLETFDRMMKFPVIETAWQQGYDVYEKMKKSNILVNWACTTTEEAIQRTAAVAAPLVHKLDGPIQFVDRTLVKGIDKLETSAPIIKESPQQIYEHTKTRIMETVQPHYEKMCALTAAGQERTVIFKDASVQKLNAVLATKYGTKAVNGVDSTSVLAEKILDYCFPVADDDGDDAPISIEENPAMHTIQTIGRLSNKVTRRVYRTVLRQVEVLRKQDVQEYVASLIAVLRISQYLNLLSQTENRALIGSDEKTEAKPKK